MINQKFIPSNLESFDSDDDSIHGDFINGYDINELSENDADSADSAEISGDSSFSETESDSDIESDSEEKDETDGKLVASDEKNTNTADLELPDQPEIDGEEDDDDRLSDCDSSDSEEVTATMQDIFGTKPNREAQRNHPPNFKTNITILDLCFHPEAELIAAATIDGESIIYRYNMEKVEEVTRFSHHDMSCRQICFNEDGSLLYSVSKDQSLAVVDVQNSSVKLHIKDAHDAPIYSFFEIDANVCATGDDDGTVKLWDLRKSSSVFEFKCGEETITSLIGCEQKKYVSATVADGSLTGINFRRKRMEAQSEMYDSDFTCQALIRSDTKLVVGSGSGMMNIFNWGDFGYQIDALKGHPDLIHSMVAITDKMIVTGCDDGNIRAVHLYDHRFLGIVGQHKDFGVENLAVSCDGSLLASCSLDDEIQFWNIEYLYDRKVDAKKKANKAAAVKRNLSSSKKRNPKEFFNDLPRKMESDDEGGPVAGPSYESD